MFGVSFSLFPRLVGLLDSLIVHKTTGIILLSHAQSPEMVEGSLCLAVQMAYCEYYFHLRCGMPTDRLRNPGGIRFGSSEIYDVLDKCFPNDPLVDAVAVGQKIDGGADERVVLFVKLPPGQTLSDDFEQKIRVEIRTRKSPRHVPARVSVWSYNNKRDLITPLQVIQAPDIPYTLNSKRVEVLVKKVSFTVYQLVPGRFILFDSDYQWCATIKYQPSHIVQPGVFDILSGHWGNPSPGN